MRKRHEFLLLLIGILIVFPVVSAEIFVAQLNDVYNVGDEVIGQVTLIPNSHIADHFLVDMICGQIRTNIFNQYYNLQPGQQQIISANTQMIEPYFRRIVVLNNTNSTAFTPINLSSNSNSTGNMSLTGNNSIVNFTSVIVNKYNDCFLDLQFGPEIGASNSFGVSQKLIIDVDLNFDKFNPGDIVEIVGEVEKQSGLLVNGFYEINISSLKTYQSGTITDGVIDLSFEIPEESKSGEHNLSLRVYEANTIGTIINEGYYFEDMKVNQLLKELKIFFNSGTVAPGKDFAYTVNTYDQAKDIINEDISVVIFKPEEKVYFKKLVKPDSEQIIKFELNDTPGYWKLEASAGDLFERKLFYLEESAVIQTSLINDTLIVTNVGNVIFEGPLEITIGSSVEIKQLKLKVGETKRFRLRAPDGDYQIIINQGNGENVLGKASLTGNAVRVLDVKNGFIEAFENPLIWWLVIILLVLIVVFVYVKRYLQNKRKSGISKSSIPENKPIIGGIKNGNKESASVIAVNSKSDKYSEYVTSTINNALGMAKNYGAKIYVDGDFKIIVFTPKLTKRKENEVFAVKVAKRIENILVEHNKKYKEKIIFGIGINQGEVISEIENGKFKFTTTGNLISGAKKLAQENTMKTLLSDTVNRRISGTVKTIKSKEGVWEVSRVIDRSKHKEFLNRFSKGK